MATVSSGARCENRLIHSGFKEKRSHENKYSRRFVFGARFREKGEAAEIRVRAERKTGELLKVTKQSGERKGLGQPKKEKSEPPTFLSAPDTLDDLGISRDQSSQWHWLTAY
jgi:hypothetical protein